MRIGILADVFHGRVVGGQPVPDNGGIGVYVQELVRALAALDGGHEYFLLSCRRDRVPVCDLPRVHHLFYPGRLANRAVRHLGLWREWAIRRHGLDLLHLPSPNEILYPWTGRPCVATIHDLIPLLMPAAFTPRIRHLYRASLGSCVRRAAVLACDSESTRRDLVRLFPRAEERSVVVPIAAQPLATRETTAIPARRGGAAGAVGGDDGGGSGDGGPPPADAAILRRLGLRRPYLLNVATIETRKNHRALFDAYVLLREAGHDLQLVCAGALGWQWAPILAHPALRRHRRDIVMPGLVERRTLAALYRNAAVFVYPSLYEGFGIPPLEAMACGAPVVASANSSLTEVLGDAPLWVGPRPEGPEIAAAVAGLLADPARRAGRVAAGRARAVAYSWRATASAMLEIYERTGRGGTSC